MIYKTSEAVFDLLNQAPISSVLGGAGKITPFVRNREVQFPVIVYNVGDEQYINYSTAIHHREGSVEVNILARSQEQADDILNVVIINTTHIMNTYADQCIYSTIDSVSRDYQEAEDSGSNGIFMTTLTLNLQIS